jgi:hypothetical protein
MVVDLIDDRGCLVFGVWRIEMKERMGGFERGNPFERAALLMVREATFSIFE